MDNGRAMLPVYAAAHLLADFACAFLFFFRSYDTGALYVGFLLYNFCAFALQMPLGLLADRFNKNALCAAFGCVLVALAFVFTGAPLLSAVIAGAGNGLFHIGGGIDVLNASCGKAPRGDVSRCKAGALGVFVSPGALGIFLGRQLGARAAVPAAAVVLMLLAAAALILILGRGKGRGFASGNAPVSFQQPAGPAALFAALCLFLVVCLRSYVGMTLAFPWKGYWSYALILAVVLGKTAGGFLCDRFGAARTSAATLALAALLFLLPGVPACAVAAVFLFNMTMPVTLWGMARLFPGAKGFAFGVLTFGLFLGFIPAYLGCPPLFDTGAGFALASAVSLVLLLAGLKLSDAGGISERGMPGWRCS